MTVNKTIQISSSSYMFYDNKFAKKKSKINDSYHNLKTLKK